MHSYRIHTLNIIQPFHKEIFSIELPENTLALTGISIAATVHKTVLEHEASINRSRIGLLSLFAQDNGQELFAEVLHGDLEVPQWERLGIGFLYPQVWQLLPIENTFQTWLPSETTLLTGYYEDTVGAPVDSRQYQVKITLRFQTL